MKVFHPCFPLSSVNAFAGPLLALTPPARQVADPVSAAAFLQLVEQDADDAGLHRSADIIEVFFHETPACFFIGQEFFFVQVAGAGIFKSTISMFSTRRN